MAKILIVKDEGILAMRTQVDLEAMGHEVVGIEDAGERAVEVARKERPEIVLMDIVLIGSMNGIEATGRINEGNGCKIIYMTAHTDEATIEAAKRTEHVGFLYKPFEFFQLKEAIDCSFAHGEMILSEERGRSGRWKASFDCPAFWRGGGVECPLGLSCVTGNTPGSGVLMNTAMRRTRWARRTPGSN